MAYRAFTAARAVAVAISCLRRTWRDGAAGGPVQAARCQPVRHRFGFRCRLFRVWRFPVEYGTLLVLALAGPGRGAPGRCRGAQGRDPAPGRYSAGHQIAGYACRGPWRASETGLVALG